MPRQHKVDPADDSYICDTDGYAVQAGCYYHIQLPDGRTLAMMPATDSRFSYMGDMAFGADHPGYFYLTNDVETPWRGDYVKFLIKKRPSDTEDHSFYLDGDEVVWDVPSLASPVYAHRASGRTVMWFPDSEGTLVVGDTPVLVDEFGDKYYALMPSSTKRSKDNWWNPLPDDLEVQFVYRQDM